MIWAHVTSRHSQNALERKVKFDDADFIYGISLDGLLLGTGIRVIIPLKTE